VKAIDNNLSIRKKLFGHDWIIAVKIHTYSLDHSSSLRGELIEVVRLKTRSKDLDDLVRITV
jgi:hypothetical protein